MASWWRKALNTAKDIGLPVVGSVVGGPLGIGAVLGGALGGALAGATGRGKPSLKNILVGGGAGALTGGAIKGAGGGIQGVKNMFTGGAPDTIKRGLEWVGKNPLPAQAIATGLQSMTSRDTSAEMMDLNRQKFEAERADIAKEEERRRKIAQILFPIYQQMYERQRGEM